MRRELNIQLIAMSNYEIRNDDDLKSLQAKTQKLFGKLMSWSTALPGNKVATAWKHAQLNLKKR